MPDQSLRLQLHDVFVKILGSENVYFQPPESLKIKYPCIVYRRSNIRTVYGDNYPYMNRIRYLVTIIDANPDSGIPDKIGSLQLSSFDRHFTKDNLNHDVYEIYY